MGAHSVLSNAPTNAPVISFKHFRSGSLFESSSNHYFLRLAGYKSSIKGVQIVHRTQVICAVNPRKVDDRSADVNKLDVKSTRKKLAVFVSGGGSNFKAIHAATCDGCVLGDVVVLVTNKTDCGGAIYAREHGIPVIQFPKTKNVSEGLSADDLVSTLRKFEVDFILLAGYLKLIPVELVRNYPKRILNIHPSLLPAFGGKGYYGLKVHKVVIASGASTTYVFLRAPSFPYLELLVDILLLHNLFVFHGYSGPTVHYVDEEYDTGRILAQRVVSVSAFDTPEELAARVLHEEHRLYVDVVEALCEDRIFWRDDGVPLIQSKEDPKHYS